MNYPLMKHASFQTYPKKRMMSHTLEHQDHELPIFTCRAFHANLESDPSLLAIHASICLHTCTCITLIPTKLLTDTKKIKLKKPVRVPPSKPS